MESVDKLRGYCDKLARVDDNIVSAEYVAERCAIDVRGTADAIEREVAERYMKLPVDADGVPIRVGDEMESGDETFVICAVAPGRVHRWHIHNIGELDKGTVAYPPSSLHHFKPRTLEDVLHELVDDALEGTGRDPLLKDWKALVGRYADELRELMEVDA